MTDMNKTDLEWTLQKMSRLATTLLKRTQAYRIENGSATAKGRFRGSDMQYCMQRGSYLKLTLDGVCVKLDLDSRAVSVWFKPFGTLNENVIEVKPSPMGDTVRYVVSRLNEKKLAYCYEGGRWYAIRRWSRISETRTEVARDSVPKSVRDALEQAANGQHETLNRSIAKMISRWFGPLFEQAESVQFENALV